MGKNHKHSKKLKSEKNKVHIKSKTKFLPKGQNITNTSFKVKSIVIQEQLKERKDSLLTKKYANITELLPKLKHFNDVVKSEACQDFKDIIAQSPESVNKHLSPIIQNASLLIQDRERKVRRAAVKLLYSIFEKISETNIRPSFKYVLTNLKCAMTHINKQIQEDSLLLLDAILEHKSALIAENFNDFFPNFLMLISKMKSQGSSERSLSLNLEGKVTSVKWRLKVLTRLYDVLEALLSERQKTIDNNTTSAVSIEIKSRVFIPVYKNISFYEDNLPSMFSQNKNSSVDFESFFVSLMKLLHDILVEAIPEKISKNAESTVLTNGESAAVFNCVVHILLLLQKHLEINGQEHIFRGTDSNILNFLMSHFPYTCSKKNFEISKEFPKWLNPNKDQNCLEENLIIVYIYIILKAKKTRINTSNNQIINSYLKKCLSSQRLNWNTFPHLLKIVQELLSDEGILCKRLGINAVEVVDSLCNFFTNAKVSEKVKTDILNTLLKAQCEKNEVWVKQLPALLCEKQISENLVDGVLDLCRKGNRLVQEEIEKNIDRILDNLVNLDKSEESTLTKMVNIFFYVPNLDEEKIRNFLQLHSAFSKYFQSLLEIRKMFK